jgi:mono/diheme cytochrome c family protein
MSAAIGSLALATLTLWAPVVAQVPQAPDVARGKRLYYQHGCYGCHGFNGETGERRLVGSPIVEKPETFIAFLRLRSDLAPLLPSTRMPSFPASTLSYAEALDLYAYVRTFVLHAPDPQTIAAFQKILESAQGAYKPSP